MSTSGSSSPASRRDKAVAGRATTALLVTLVAAGGIGARRPAAPETDGSLIAARLPRIEYRGGPFVRRPRIVTVTFGGDEPRTVAALERFGRTIAGTLWWRTATGGYCAAPGECVGEGEPGTAVRLDELLPASLHAVDLSARLRRYATAGRFGVLDADTVLLVYLPARVKLSDAFVDRFCNGGPRAFHRALRLDGLTIGYAVMPRCGDEGLVTATASHELVETVLGPDTARRGFVFADEPRARGFTAAGQEAMDPCGFITAGSTDTREGAFVVRRAWSNEAASRGQDPCVPHAAGRPFVALAPRTPAVRLTRDGDSIVIALDAAADRPVSSWLVSAIDLTGAQEGRRYVEVALDRSLVAPGDTVALRITRRAAHPRLHSVVGAVSVIDGHRSLWPIGVSMR